jgi:hypothetical protein
MDLHANKVWVPGVACCLLFFGLYFPLYFLFSSLPIYTNVASSQHRFLLISIPCLAVMPFAGALGAYLSRRMKGSVVERILSALFPVFTFAALFAVRIVYGLFFEREPYTLSHFLAGLSLTLIAGIVGGLFLVLGAWPFCKRDSAADRGSGGSGSENKKDLLLSYPPPLLLGEIAAANQDPRQERPGGFWIRNKRNS